jgi:hypothetical protein
MNGMAEKYNLMIPAFEKVPAISRVMPYQKNEGDTDPQDEIEAATNIFNEQHIFSKKLQKSGYEEGQVAMVRQVMDAAVLGLENAHIDHELLGEYTCTYMNRDSDFIKYATFVEAVEKIQLGNEENLTIDEKTTVKALLVAPEVEDVSEEDSDEIESAMSNLKPTASDTPRTKR